MNPTFSSEDIYKNKSFVDLYEEWKKRINKNKESKKTHISIMQTNNPLLIPRNHIVEECLTNVCENNDYNNFIYFFCSFCPFFTIKLLKFKFMLIYRKYLNIRDMYSYENP